MNTNEQFFFVLKHSYRYLTLFHDCCEILDDALRYFWRLIYLIELYKIHFHNFENFWGETIAWAATMSACLSDWSQCNTKSFSGILYWIENDSFWYFKTNFIEPLGYLTICCIQTLCVTNFFNLTIHLDILNLIFFI